MGIDVLGEYGGFLSASPKTTFSPSHLWRFGENDGYQMEMVVASIDLVNLEAQK